MGRAHPSPSGRQSRRQRQPPGQLLRGSDQREDEFVEPCLSGLQSEPLRFLPVHRWSSSRIVTHRERFDNMPAISIYVRLRGKLTVPSQLARVCGMARATRRVIALTDKAPEGFFDQPMAGFQRVIPAWPDRKRGPWQLNLTFELVDGRFSLVGLEIKPAGKPTRLNSGVLRSISLGRLFDADKGLAELLPPSRVREALVQGTSPSPGRPLQYGHDHLVRVASIYREAWTAGGHPTKTVAQRLHMSRSAAAKWVAKARDAGLLAPTERGRAGGILKRRKR